MLTNIKFTYYVINLLKMRYFVFVENERLAQNLCLYTLQPLQAVTDEFQEIVDYLKSHGAEYVAFDHPSDSIYRSDYMFCETNY